MDLLPISGTFLDEITHDIPSQNWSEKQWRREFELYTRIGIDTVIIAGIATNVCCETTAR